MESEDLRSRRTKANLRDSLIKMLLKQPFSKINVKALCEQALLTRGTFYRHYLDKYDLLNDVLSYLTVPTSAISFETLFLHPAESLRNMSNDILFQIFKKQNHDLEFQQLQRDFYINYYSKLLEPMDWQSPLPKSLFIAAFVDTILTFESWQVDHQKLTAAQYDQYFKRILRLPQVQKWA